jgi:hypothetical protein
VLRSPATHAADVKPLQPRFDCRICNSMPKHRGMHGAIGASGKQRVRMFGRIGYAWFVGPLLREPLESYSRA